ncbi:WcbI family polysaccharide biosynthesis putative acetyltransferase [Pseudodesulfovibrio sp.]|uniref:WcbI family polysaccharide biosynthesis putative acetyltransferase n=1 Tax=unclassified Pseudodesulfovibrio TaxID=2661612 RepID=UPI003B002289
MKKLCLIYGNCQGSGLSRLLAISSEFANTYNVVVTSNWENKTFPVDLLPQSDLFLYQPTKAWERAPSTERMLEMLPVGSRAISFPYMYCNGLWPFHRRSSRKNTGPQFPCERHYYADVVLDELAASPLPMDRIKKIYMALDFEKEYSAAQAMEESLSLQRDKEKTVDIKTVSVIQTLIKRVTLFFTVRHPSPFLYYVAANQVLAILGLPKIGLRQLPFAGPIYKVDYHHPIHPGLAKQLGLSYVTPDTRYNLWGQNFTYEQYLEDYVTHRRMHAELEQLVSREKQVAKV